MKYTASSRTKLPVFLVLFLLFCASAFPVPITDIAIKEQIHPMPRKAMEQKAIRPTTEKHANPIIDRNALRVPIILYHHIRPIDPAMDPLARGLSVTPAVFEAQLAFFEKQGFSSMSLEQLRQAMDKKFPLPKKPIILTFDDGYADNFTFAYPLLKKHHFSGSLFIFTNGIGTPDYLTWNQVKEMHASGVFEIGSHTLNHADLPVISATNMRQEIMQSKEIIEKRLGVTVSFFCYPYGHYTKHIMDEVERAGYLGAVTTHYGVFHTRASLFETTRVRLTNDDIGARLEKKMQLLFK